MFSKDPTIIQRIKFLYPTAQKRELDEYIFEMWEKLKEK